MIRRTLSRLYCSSKRVSMQTTITATTLNAMRKDYESPPLKKEDLLPTPIDMFCCWFTKASQVEKAVEVNAFNIATIGVDGWPSNRFVLLKEVSKGGFVFFTNYNSAKGQGIAAHDGKASACFYWPTLNYQVRIQGVCEKLTSKESDDYFDSRPVDSRISAIVSPQSQPIEHKDVLDKQIKIVKEEFEASGEKPKRPENWGGYRIMPHTVEFWQGNRSRLHDRFVYTQKGTSAEGLQEWNITQLAP